MFPRPPAANTSAERGAEHELGSPQFWPGRPNMEPSKGMHRGELANLNTQYLLDIEEQGYSLVRCDLAVFKPEV